MERTLATIVTEIGIARLVHDSELQTLEAHYPDGHSEAVADWSPVASWRSARKQIIAWYGNNSAYHDDWVLCLRPTRALVISRSEQEIRGRS